MDVSISQNALSNALAMTLGYFNLAARLDPGTPP